MSERSEKNKLHPLFCICLYYPCYAIIELFLTDRNRTMFSCFLLHTGWCEWDLPLGQVVPQSRSGHWPSTACQGCKAPAFARCPSDPAAVKRLLLADFQCRNSAAWKTSVTVPKWKGKGHGTECANYRPIRLLCRKIKIFKRILDKRLRNIVKITPQSMRLRQGVWNN